MIVERAADCGLLYRSVRARLLDLVGSLTETSGEHRCRPRRRGRCRTWWPTSSGSPPTSTPDGLRLLGSELGSHFVGDLLQHTQDVCAALGRRPVPDDEALAVGLDFYVDTFHSALVTGGTGSVVVRAADDVWTLGAGPEVATITADRFELFRALGGRRSEAQLRRLAWIGDVDRVLPAMSAYPPPAADLDDGRG